MLAYDMNTVKNFEEENPKIKLLEDRIEALERALEKYQEHPSDVAAGFRRRLAAVHSNWVILTMDREKKPKVGDRYKIIRVEQSDPKYFLVTERGNRKDGIMKHRDEIERLISEQEAKTK